MSNQDFDNLDVSENKIENNDKDVADDLNKKKSKESSSKRSVNNQKSRIYLI